MKRTQDIQDLLRDWPYDPAKAVRVIQGDDGRDVLQVRTPVGLEQFELEGRPDGLRPHNQDSAFDFYLGRRKKSQAAGEESAFHLSHPECVELFEEGVLYYFRYLHLFQLEDWPRTARDTGRNLRMFDFVRQFAHRKEDRQHLEQWRPYILRINGIARAMLEVEEHAHERALHILRETIEKIDALELIDNHNFQAERERSLQSLQETVEQIEKNKPLTELEQLEKQLRAAVDEQAFERAAALRDQIREVRTRPARVK
ncbi:MAG: UvrB/UvrC motif-containing protein [Verrucomicrobiota bacterium]